MKSRWYKGCKTEEDRAQRDKEIAAARPALNVLRNILEEDLRTVDRDSLKKDHYYLPSWSEYQADRIGAKRELKRIIEDLLPND